jgi:hypothetical protein
MDLFLNLAPSDFTDNIAGHIVKKSKHEVITRELMLINRKLEWAACVADDIEQMLGVMLWWQ